MQRLICHYHRTPLCLLTDQRRPLTHIHIVLVNNRFGQLSLTIQSCPELAPVTSNCYFLYTFIFISNLCLFGRRPQKTIECITGQSRKIMLFEYIVKETNNVTIGPLEYCGNAKVITTAHGIER